MGLARIRHMTLRTFLNFQRFVLQPPPARISPFVTELNPLVHDLNCTFSAHGVSELQKDTSLISLERISILIQFFVQVGRSKRRSAASNSRLYLKTIARFRQTKDNKVM